ncbi:MFS transporter [Streptomyces sp. NPDC002187]|uniref:MFS transporter n=1 Tax=Streptomyces sp. NPDC002187 TaxID=3364637 RepID=UPI003673BF3B
MSSRRHRRLTLAGSITGAAIVALDGTVLVVAQPTLQRDLDASFVQVQWTSTGYLIAVASLLVFAGRLGDRYGHQRVFAAGMVGFAAASAGIGLAPGIGWVIGLRVVQGIFGALLQPATLGMLRAVYPPDRLGTPIALRTSAVGLAAAAGPVVGGALVAHLGWRAVFLVNVVPALVMGLLALAVRVPQPRNAGAVRLDLPGAGLLALALVCLVHTLVETPRTGWTGATALGCGVFTAASVAFVRHERRTASPLVPPALLGSAAVPSALAVLLAASASLFGTLFVGTYFLQDVLALDPLETGLRVLPLALTMVLSAPASALLLRRQGPRRTAVAAMALLALGILAVSRLDQASTPIAIGGSFLLLGAGFGPVMVAATAVVVRQASVGDAGVAGGLQQTAMNIGPTLGVAAATMLVSVSAPRAVDGRSGGGPHWSGESFASAMGSALMALAAVALIGALLGIGLPGRTGGRASVLPDTARRGAAGGVRACRADHADARRPESARPAGPPAPPA